MAYYTAGTANYYDAGTTSGTDTMVWGYWQNTAGTANTVWQVWVDTGTSTSTTTDVWYDWNARPTTQLARREQEAYLRVERLAKEQEDRHQAERLAKEREDKERAEKLLREVLDEKQVKELDAKNAFEVQAQSGKLYRIRRGRAGNVVSLDEKRRHLAQYCIHPNEPCPDADVMLAQYLWLKWNEEEFLKTANITSLLAPLRAAA